MIDLHSHILPGLDDGAQSLDVSIDMARMWVEDGVTTVACTPHILPGLYANTGPAIIEAVAELQLALAFKEIDLKLVAGADNHIAGDFVAGLKSGKLLSLAGSRYVLVEPPHHVCPPRLDQFFFDITVAGYVPVLTHPERLTWIENQYDKVVELARKGIWMQLTSGSLTGQFGRRPKYWAERLLDDGLATILASDAHNTEARRPDLKQGFEIAARRIGDVAALHLVKTRPLGIVENISPNNLPMPVGLSSTVSSDDGAGNEGKSNRRAVHAEALAGADASAGIDGASAGWLRRVFGA